MNLQFNTEKEKRAFELLQKYLNTNVSKHLAEVQKWYDTALKNDYSVSELLLQNRIYCSRYGYKEPSISYTLETKINAKDVSHVVSTSLDYYDLSNHQKITSFEFSKSRNEEILKINEEINELKTLLG